MKRFLLASLVVALGLTVVGLVFFQRPSARPVAPQNQVSPLPKELPLVAAVDTPTENVPAQEIIPRTPPREVEVKSKATPPPRPVAANSAVTKKPKAPLDPEARFALSFVGSDPEAEQYWLEAINDPGLPANERKNLIEDLNEDGLSDPSSPGLQDLPLIMNRLSILQQLASDPMDKVNYDAIQEAYRDLWEMYNKLTVK